jgi:hypothetical protein
MRMSTVVLVAGVSLAGIACSAPLRAEPLVTKVGIGTFIHPIQEPAAVPMPSCYQEGPCQCRKERVYIFGVNGLNPLCLGNFNGMLDYFRKQGFENNYFGQLYTSHWFADKIREIRRTDPDARIALIGFSLGASYVQAVANSLAKDGTKVDLVVYLVGDLVANTAASRPDNVVRVVNVRAKGLVLQGGGLLCATGDIDGASNHRFNCRHILAPSRRETLELLIKELLMLACFREGAPAVK